MLHNLLLWRKSAACVESNAPLMVGKAVCNHGRDSPRHQRGVCTILGVVVTRLLFWALGSVARGPILLIDPPPKENPH